MATCPVCGYEFEPASAENVRCPACGAPLAGEKTPDAEDAPAAEAAPAAPEGAEPAAGDSAEGPVVSADAAPEAPSPEPAAAGAPGTEVHPVIADPYRPSPLARAWEDFKASPGKLWIILKLALFQFVPGVGSLVLNGYVYTWGARAGARSTSAAAAQDRASRRARQRTLYLRRLGHHVRLPHRPRSFLGNGVRRAGAPPHLRAARHRVRRVLRSVHGGRQYAHRALRPRALRHQSQARLVALRRPRQDRTGLCRDGGRRSPS